MRKNHSAIVFSLLLLLNSPRELSAAPIPNPTASDGVGNTAGGSQALAIRNELEAERNTAFGNFALGALGTGSDNTSMGSYSLRNTLFGGNNSAVGTYSLKPRRLNQPISVYF